MVRIVSVLDLIHLSATMGFCTLLWIVQILVYPQMAEVSATSMQAYHQRHMNRIRWIVGPLFLVEGGAAAISFVFGFPQAPMLQSFSLGLFLSGAASHILRFCPAPFGHGPGTILPEGSPHGSPQLVQGCLGNAPPAGCRSHRASELIGRKNNSQVNLSVSISVHQWLKKREIHLRDESSKMEPFTEVWIPR